MNNHFNCGLSTRPHTRQRYNTVGDWEFQGDDTLVRVALLPDRRYEMLVAVHELIEAELCRHRGISEADVTAWDLAYEAQRKEGDVSEPGDDPCCPYREPHIFATKIEQMLAEALGVDWAEYAKAIEEL